MGSQVIRGAEPRICPNPCFSSNEPYKVWVLGGGVRSPYMVPKNRKINLYVYVVACVYMNIHIFGLNSNLDLFHAHMHMNECIYTSGHWACTCALPESTSTCTRTHEPFFAIWEQWFKLRRKTLRYNFVRTYS